MLYKAIKFNEETNLINIATNDIEFAGVQVNYTIMVDEKTIDNIAKVEDFTAVIQFIEPVLAAVEDEPLVQALSSLSISPITCSANDKDWNLLFPNDFDF